MKKKKEPVEGLSQFRVDRMVTVTDDWHPNYEGNKVKLSIFLSYMNKPDFHTCFVRMCVWGADDDGMEIDYTGIDYDDLKWHYDLWKKNIFDKVPDGVNKEWFYEHGFYRA